MRWKQKNPKNFRVIKRFALFPVCINGECRWLEIVRIRQLWKQVDTTIPRRSGGVYKKFMYVNYAFIDNE